VPSLVVGEGAEGERSGHGHREALPRLACLVVLDEHRDRVRHLRAPALPGAQNLEAEAPRHGLPTVLGRTVDAVHSSGRGHAAELPRTGEHPQTIGVTDIIIGHGASLLLSRLVSQTDRMRRPTSVRQGDPEYPQPWSYEGGGFVETLTLP
jgi:hypothetical protein